jgi:hypothetical protein
VVWAALAVDAAWDIVTTGWRSLVPDEGVPPRWLATAITGIAGLALLIVAVAPVPARFDAADASDDTWARDWVDAFLPQLEPEPVVVSWWSYSTPLWYAQRVEGLRPDIAIIDDRTRIDENLGSLTDVIDENLGKRPVYVIRIDTNEVRLLANRYDLEYIDGGDARMLTRVIGRKAS